MDAGTRLRTVLLFATCINQALAVMDLAQFNNPTVDHIYKIVSAVLLGVIAFVNTWYNNSYTPEGAEGTGYTRALKANHAEIEQNECGEVEPIDDFDSEDYEEIEDEEDIEEV